MAVAVLTHLTETGNTWRPTYLENHVGITYAHVLSDRLQCSPGGNRRCAEIDDEPWSVKGQHAKQTRCQRALPR